MQDREFWVNKSVNTFDLTGKTAVVTGANTGLGQGIAIALAQAGAAIIATGRSDLSDTQSRIEKVGGTMHAIACDLQATGAAAKLFEQIDALGLTADILVNNAGIIARNDALDFTEEEWDSVMNINAKQVMFLSQQFARRLVAAEKPGKIINIASMLSYQGGIRVASYTSSKSAVMGLTRLLANEWAGKGICVNAIAPGYFATNNTAALQADETRNRQILERIPAGRWGDPSDLGGAAVFLASSASDYVHGITLPVDGGWLAR